MARVLFVAGTRPEVIKLSPVLLSMRRRSGLETRLCVTGQHRGLLDQALQVFGVTPDYDLDVMTSGQTLSSLTARLMSGLEGVLAQDRPDLVVVQGDTTTTLCGALAGFYGRVPVAHVEAGLRTGDIDRPYPEEMNRLLTTRLSALHFAPTERAAGNLRAEGVDPQRIFVTGNSGIDAVLYVRDALERGTFDSGSWPYLETGSRLIVVTAHRRESFGAPLLEICSALKQIAARADVRIVWPIHPNPHVSEVAQAQLAGVTNVFLIPPLAYVPFVDLMRRAHILLTDSGGIQEEGPSLGKPVLVLREETERPEAVEAGTTEIVGARADRIVASVERLLDDNSEYIQRTVRHNPYGDGRTGERVAEAVENFLNRAH